MFKSNENAGDLNGFLDAGSHIQGELSFEDTFRVDGKVTGKVTSKGDLVVGEAGEVDGEIHVGRIFVSGTVRGEVQADRRVEIASNGRVYAKLLTSSLVVEDGALLEGECSMKQGSTSGSTPGSAAGKGAEASSAGNSPAKSKAPSPKGK